MASQGKLQVAILDDYFDIAPAKFSHLSKDVDIVSFPNTLNARKEDERQELVARLKPFDVISTMRERTVFSAEVLRGLPNLRLILTTGMGNAAIDLATCKELGVVVTGATGAGRSNDPNPPTIKSLDSTCEHNWALILSLARNIAHDDQVVRQGGWQTEPAIGLKGKTLALLGLGKLGLMSAKVALLGFGMNVIAWSTNLTQADADEKAKSAGLPRGSFAVVASKEELMRRADILSIHYVLSDRSRNLVGAQELSMMKPSAMLINTSRGPIVNEPALLDVLQRGKIRGAALDVYDTEPLPADSPWRSTPWGEGGRSKVLLAPHTGYTEEQVMHRWYDETVENVGRYIRGEELWNKITK